MLTDIFAYRYADVPMWDSFTERDRKVLVQMWLIVSEQLYPTGKDGKDSDYTKAKWKSINDRLSRELGLKELSERRGGYWGDFANKRNWISFERTWRMVCDNFVGADLHETQLADEFIKERLSLVEIAFRDRENELADRRQRLDNPTSADILIASLTAHGGKVQNEGLTVKILLEADEAMFRQSVEELNERLRRAGYKLHYHNGFIQISDDERVEKEIETPFWTLVADPKWRNVDTDMKEAIDRRDARGRDPSLYAAKALESTIKIISREKGWTHGGEKGAHNYIENLAAKGSGRFIERWEAESMKHFFTHIRNPLGHGPGGEPMPKLNLQQTNWAIQFCMSWAKSLIERL